MEIHVSILKVPLHCHDKDKDFKFTCPGFNSTSELNSINRNMMTTTILIDNGLTHTEIPRSSHFTLSNILVTSLMFVFVSSSRLQAIPLFEAYRLGTSTLGMIRTAVGHHSKFEFVLSPGLEPRSPACKASMLTTTPTAPMVPLIITSLAKEVMFLVALVSLSVCLFVCLSVCGQHYSKSYERIGMKFYGRVLSSTRKN